MPRHDAEGIEGRQGRAGEKPYAQVERKSRQSAEHQEEEVLDHDGPLGQTTQVASAGRGSNARLLLDARPRQVDIEQQQENTEADDGRLVGEDAAPLAIFLVDPNHSSSMHVAEKREKTHIKSITVPHQGVMQQVPIDLLWEELVPILDQQS